MDSFIYSVLVVMICSRSNKLELRWVYPHFPLRVPLFEVRTDFSHTAPEFN